MAELSSDERPLETAIADGGYCVAGPQEAVALPAGIPAWKLPDSGGPRLYCEWEMMDPRERTTRWGAMSFGARA
jgi:hypothetical protein